MQPTYTHGPSPPVSVPCAGLCVLGAGRQAQVPITGAQTAPHGSLGMGVPQVSTTLVFLLISFPFLVLLSHSCSGPCGHHESENA